ncbi:hypothetical protein H5410_004739 [Solanum commersonii]|uniref:Uncharacterized protein n=1 Tax=Solanum commersonii TaxID=4109 RepID=A0A9J6A4P9_SOLCO|nr:hypothetical protein H5410_004739 [Solanum commersonii]
MCFLIFRPFWGIYVIFGHFRVVTKRSKVLFLIRHDILRSLGIYVIFDNFWAVTKRSQILFSYSSRYSKVNGASQNFFELRKEVKFCSLIRYDIKRSLGIYVIFGHFQRVTKRSKVLFVIRHDILRSLVQEVTKRSKVLFSNLSRYSKVIGVSHWCMSKFFGVIFCNVYVCFLIFLPFWGIYVKFGHYRSVTKRSKVLFSYSSRYYKVIGVSQNSFEAFFVSFICFLIFWPFWGIYVIFSHFREVTKRSKILFVIHHDILMSLVQVEIYLRHFLYCLCVFVIFRSFWGIYVMFGRFRAITKRGIVLFTYSSRYSKVIGASLNFYDVFCFVYVYLLIFWPFWGIYVIFGNFRFFSLIHHDILRSLVQVEIFLGIFCIVYVCFLIFRPFWGIYIIFNHFRGVTKRSKVLFSYSSRYYKVIGGSPNFFEVVYVCFLIYWPFWSIYVIFGHFRAVTKEVNFCSVI